MLSLSRSIHIYSCPRSTSSHKPVCQVFYRKRPTHYASFFATSATTASTTPDQDSVLDRSITIQDVTISSPPKGSGRPDLIPSTMHNSLLHQWTQQPSSLPPTWREHLRWCLQKDMALEQDFCLLGSPALARDRRLLLLTYAALTDREVEYVSLTRDTSHSDLKQRKEVVFSAEQNDTSSVYRHQAPVRAALQGRLLILDGLEKAERNVLPLLNNLLENREMSLDDGSLLVASHVYDTHHPEESTTAKKNTKMAKIHRVHPDFRVAALASLERQSSSTLDPPLRSRFQARVQAPLEPGELLETLAQVVPQMKLDRLESLILQANEQTNLPQPQQAAQDVSLAVLSDTARYWFQNETHVTLKGALQAHGGNQMIGVDHVVKPFERLWVSAKNTNSSSSFVTTGSSQTVMDLIHTGRQQGRAVALVAPKGTGKNALVNEAARQCGLPPPELFSLHPDMMARDLLVTRNTDSTGNTVWVPTALTRAVQNGTWVLLDGIDKLRSDTLASLSRLLEHGQIDIPNNDNVNDENGDATTHLTAHPDFCCIALAHPPDTKKSWITPEVKGMFFWIQAQPLPADELKQVLMGRFPELEPALLDMFVRLSDHLDQAVANGAADTVEEQESLTLSLRKMIHICRRLRRQGASSHLRELVRDALMTSLMPEREQRIVEQCLETCGIQERSKEKKSSEKPLELDPELIQSCQRTPTNPLLVPNPRFVSNPNHTKILCDLLDAHSVGERALLIMGYQGCGKNRVVDSLLHRLSCEREYLQLHRDTTVQSLLSSPSVEGGRLVFEDSPLVRAAIHGRILVVDEADKAPVEVVAILKGLIEDGELCLPDGRVLQYEEPVQGNNNDQETVLIHPDFRVWALANPAGYPFHGNHLAKEMGDVFSCHTVPNLDTESSTKILKLYGPNLSAKTIERVTTIWKDLIKAHAEGLLAYPFSLREAVNVVRHLEKFPEDSFEMAIDNVISFDQFDTSLMKQLKSIFRHHGVKLQTASTSIVSGEGREGGISTPKTRSSMPKHGKHDPTGNPHVGGNTWAGGTGGSDTAGLGGRGGPYRLDLGHKVHQVSDEMKAQVSKEAQRKAKEMGERALAEKLKEINMGKSAWKRYDNLRQRVDVQIQQLQVLLKDIKRRKDERVWLRRQSTGELDDSRIVDALAGEKDVFKRRGKAPDEGSKHKQNEEDDFFITLVVDVSASMYRFNSYDGRLERLLEATLMIMEALKDDPRFRLQIVGHNGSSARIPLAKNDSTKDPANQLKVLEEMVAHTQYTWAGDSTLEAVGLAVGQARDDELVLIISDANLQRYRIEPEQLGALLQRKDVHSHLVLIGSMGDEAFQLANAIPNGRAQVCSKSEELPLQLKNILASVART